MEPAISRICGTLGSNQPALHMDPLPVVLRIINETSRSCEQVACQPRKPEHSKGHSRLSNSNQAPDDKTNLIKRVRHPNHLSSNPLPGPLCCLTDYREPRLDSRAGLGPIEQVQPTNLSVPHFSLPDRGGAEFFPRW